MAVTTQNSTEYAATLATPLVKASARSNTGKLRTLAFSFNQDGVGDAGSIIVLGKLPAGRVKIIGGLSRFYCNIVASSATIDIGWQAYNDTSGTAVTADPDGMVDGLDVDTVGYQTMKVILLQLSCLVVIINLIVMTELSLKLQVLPHLLIPMM